jgi:hypothetical protein
MTFRESQGRDLAPTVTQLPVFSSYDTKLIASELSKFCVQHVPPTVLDSDYLITLKLWQVQSPIVVGGKRNPPTSQDSLGGDGHLRCPSLACTVHVPGTQRNPGIFYREITLDKIKDVEGLIMILEEYR